MKDKTKAFDEPYPKADFVAELTPHRSLGRAGFMILMTFVSVTCFLSGMMFWAIGAWPVLVFMVLDVIVIWLAFKLNNRSARAKERISIGRHELKIQKIDPAGRMTEHVFNPFWARFEVVRHKEIGITGMRITSEGVSLSIGSFLNPQDRESFALAFGNALGRVRG
ncbi:MAG: DUF2244 domain-containing protein [Rhizobiaceae bacterium]